MVGQSQKLVMTDAVEYYKAKGLDLSKVLYRPDVDENIPVRNVSKQEHNLSSVIDFKILKSSRLAIEKKIKMSLDYQLKILIELSVLF